MFKAVSDCHLAEVSFLMLHHPDLNVNLQNKYGYTPFSNCCTHGHVAVVCELLKDPRVDVILDDGLGRTPLWWASHMRQLEVVEWLVASGRDLGDVKGIHWKDGKESTPLEMARKGENAPIIAVLERFLANPAQTRCELRVKLGVLGAADVFALAVFLCDDLLQLKPDAAATTTTSRFFSIASKLPLELQMVLCHRAVGSMKQNILRKDSENAFKDLVRILLSPPSQLK